MNGDYKNGLLRDECLRSVLSRGGRFGDCLLWLVYATLPQHRFAASGLLRVQHHYLEIVGSLATRNAISLGSYLPVLQKHIATVEPGRETHPNAAISMLRAKQSHQLWEIAEKTVGCHVALALYEVLTSHQVDSLHQYAQECQPDPDSFITTFNGWFARRIDYIQYAKPLAGRGESATFPNSPQDPLAKRPRNFSPIGAKSRRPQTSSDGAKSKSDNESSERGRPTEKTSGLSASLGALMLPPPSPATVSTGLQVPSPSRSQSEQRSRSPLAYQKVFSASDTIEEYRTAGGGGALFSKPQPDAKRARSRSASSQVASRRTKLIRVS